MDIIRAPQGGQFSHSDCDHIKRGSEVFDDVHCVLCEAYWKRFEKFDLVEFVNSVEIRLYDAFAWCFLVVGMGGAIELGEAFLSPSDSQLRVFEMIHQGDYDRQNGRS